MTDTLSDRVTLLVDRLEQLFFEGHGDASQLADELSTLESEARFFQADDVSEGLREVEPVLREWAAASDQPHGDLLPLLFRLRETVQDAAGREDHVGQPALQLDLQSEIDEVLTITQAGERILNSGLLAGQLAYLGVIRVDPDRIDAVEAILERELQLLTSRRHDETSRLTFLAVESAPPAVERLMEAHLDDASVLKAVNIRQIDVRELKRETSVAQEWYARLPEISVRADPGAVEGVRRLLDTIDPGRGGPALPALWEELRSTIAGTLTVYLRHVLQGMQDSLEEMAAAEDKRIALKLEGSATAVGAEVAELLRDVLFELFANAITHGIETEAERVAAGKSAVGTVRCIAHEHADGITIRVHDDGRGIGEGAVARVPRGGLHRARAILQDRFGGTLTVKSGSGGASAIVDLPAVQGLFRAVVARRGDRAFAVPATMVEWAGIVDETRRVADAGGAQYVRYRRSLVPLVEAPLVGDRPADATGGPAVDAGAAVVLRVARTAIALAADTIVAEEVVTTNPDGTLRRVGAEAETCRSVALQDLPVS